jgi:hypothetical protein
MGAPEKEKPSVLGLGQPVAGDPSVWRPSQAAHERESDSSSPGDATGKPENSAWRPSKVAQERLSSLSSARPRRRFAMPTGVRTVLTFVFFICAAYFFVSLWLSPEAGQLRPELAVAAGVLALLFIFAMAGTLMRRRRKRGDDKSILRL